MTQATRRAECDDRLLAAARGLPGPARTALREMLRALRELALANACASAHRHKWLMHASWRTVAVYSGHFLRAARTSADPARAR